HSNSTLADSSATGTNSVAIGPASTATEEDSIALGNGAAANFANSIALGAGSVTVVGAESSYAAYRLSTPQSSIGEIAIGGADGNRKITGVAAGTNDNDAVNVAQLIAVGNVVDDHTTSITNLSGRVTNVETIVNNLGTGGSTMYFHTNSTQADSVASGTDSVAVGANAQASGTNAIAMGTGATAQSEGSIALGAGASDNNRGGETYVGKYSNADNTSVGTVSVGNADTGETRTVSNVADGILATDAVNLRQLDGAVAESKQYTDDSIQSVNASIGQVDNRITNNETNIASLQQGTSGMLRVNNTETQAAPAATGANSVAAGAGASAAGNNATAIGNGAVAQNDNSLALGANSLADRDNSVSVGSAGNERQITNVAAGTSDTDAVNLAQLNSSVSGIANNSNRYTDQRFNQLKHDLHRQDKILSAGIASAMSMASLPQPYTPGANMMALGGASYRGESALSLGISHLSGNGRWVTKAQVNTNTQENVSWGIGVGYQF
ncbi:cell surface protein, partial [Brenneria roseae subsp. roseae]|uniref:YadA family autotransporter adhesin n=1 Tax=Brenneria roseae TaxID=1509241 RepID=UPI000D620EEA